MAENITRCAVKNINDIVKDSYDDDSSNQDSVYIDILRWEVSDMTGCDIPSLISLPNTAAGFRDRLSTILNDLIEGPNDRELLLNIVVKPVSDMDPVAQEICELVVGIRKIKYSKINRPSSRKSIG